jgi:hypothetical protein
MSYFKNFPQILYSFDTGTTVGAFVMTDLLRRVKADDANIQNVLAYDEYDIIEGETPEIIADKLYNEPTLHWVVLISNEILDPRFDWPLTTRALELHITDKYGAGNENGIHHYENTYGDIVHSSYAGTKTSVTNTEYEIAHNETKRRIKVLKAKFVPQFIQTFNGILNNGNN